MPISGFPDIIEVTLGSVWSGKNGLDENDVVSLTRIAGTDSWSEDGTDTPNDTTNRIKFSPRVDPGWTAGYYYFRVEIKMTSAGTWSPGGMVTYHITGDSVYNFKELWTLSPAPFVMGYTAYNNGFWIAKYPSYNSGIFSSMAEGSGGVTTTTTPESTTTTQEPTTTTESPTTTTTQEPTTSTTTQEPTTSTTTEEPTTTSTGEDQTTTSTGEIPTTTTQGDQTTSTTEGTSTTTSEQKKTLAKRELKLIVKRNKFKCVVT